MLIVYSLVSPLWAPLVTGLPDGTWAVVGRAFLYSWLALGMAVSWIAKETEARFPQWPWLSKMLLYVGGYGPLLCAVTFAAYIKEWRGASMAWDKTVKTGKVGLAAVPPTAPEGAHCRHPTTCAGN